MKQLVLQFRNEDLDAVIAVENALIAHLGSSAEVDGHDIGSGEANIFILTADPVATFESSQKFLTKSSPSVQTFSAAWRSLDSEQFTVLWPPGQTHFQVA